MTLSIERFAHAKFNSCSIYIRDKYFKGVEQEQELLSFIIELSSILNLCYGYISQKRQERRQSPVLTPAERLPGLFWANFFGHPYIDFFGREKLLATPCYEAREIREDLIMLLTSESPYRLEMMANDDVVNSIESYLNQNAFAGPSFPDELCAVPRFDFSEIRLGIDPPILESREEKLSRIRLELEAKGFILMDQSPGHLRFRGKDNSMVVVDLSTGSISLDMTEEDVLKDYMRKQGSP